MRTIALSPPSLCGLMLLVAIIATQILFSQNLAAQAIPEGQLKLIQMYDELLDNPTDVKMTLDYAAYAVEIGDYEAAIPPLERLLLSTPNATNVMLELGILYYMLDAKEVSRQYFEDVKAQAGAHEEMVQKADAYLKRMQ